VYESAELAAGRNGDASGWSTEPLFKWIGGKRGLVKHLLPLLPERFGTYFEPFAGGAALFFALAAKQACLGDLNPDLIECYEQVRDDPEGVIKALRRLGNSEVEYYRIRKRRPRNPWTRAARLIYLATLSFNGVHRVNLKGEFNVPYGQRPEANPCKPERVRQVSKALASAKLICSDFEQTVANAQPGDLVYFDPPYASPFSGETFLKYTNTVFKWSDQTRLSIVAAKLLTNGCTVVLTNADHPEIAALYPRFEGHSLRRHSVVSANGNGRGQVTECIYVGRP
jgi:DNA adenine methylase